MTQALAKTPMGGEVHMPPLSADQRHQMVAEAAYYRALHRGFDGGNAEEDWYAAEAEIEQATASAAQQEQELAVYARLRRRTSELLAEAGEIVDPATVGHALGRAVDEVRQAGHGAGDTVSRAAHALKSELAHAVHGAETALGSASAKTPEIFAAWRARGEAALEQGSAAVRSWLHEVGVHAGPHHTGEMTFAGTLECTHCGAHVTLAAAGHVPPCPKCQHTEFRRL